MIFSKLASLFATTLCVVTMASCAEKESYAGSREIIINEIMPSNRTGLLTSKGKPSDWIELLNTSENDSINLKGFSLAVIKPKPDFNPFASVEIDEVSAEKDGEIYGESEIEVEVDQNVSVSDTVVTWNFPEVKVGPGEYVVVFADKKKKKKKDKDEDGDDIGSGKKKGKKKGSVDLIADLSLPKEGATLQLRAPDGQVISEVKYDEMAPDQAYARQDDDMFAVTFLQSPGFANTRDGAEAAGLVIDGQRKDALRIWEVMSRSTDTRGNWVELKNVGDTAVDLSQYALGKKASKTDGWKLPARKLAPGEFITVQLAGKSLNRYTELQAPFKPGGTETIVLTKDGKFVDGVNARQTSPGGSIGRMNGQPGLFYFSTPTRNADNGTSGRRFIAPMPAFDRRPGAYVSPDRLVLRLREADKDRVVHYTLDGSQPTSASPVLRDSLVLTRTTTVRMFAEGDSTSLRSRTATNTYLLGVNHTVPIVNITVNENDLYSYTSGIYADGPGYSPQWPHKGANYWKNWTKNAHVELFDEGEGFSVDCGLSIFGGFSRFEAKKSFRLKFRGGYGDPEVRYDVFGDGQPLELEDLVLRSGSQDWNRCMVRDEFFTSLMQAQSPNLLTQLYRPAALYVNGKYFGLYYLREKIDNHFVGRKLDVPSDNISMIFSRYRERGSDADYREILSFVNSRDMKNNANFEVVRSKFDLEGLIDFKLGEMFAGNTDVGNVRYVRSTDPKSDKKWHIIFYDLDATWVGNKPSASFYLSTGGDAANVSVHNTLINRLLQNKEFRKMFLERLSHHMTNTFNKENTTAVFDKLVEQIRPEMKQNCQRWPQLSYDQWEKNVAKFREKFDEKPKVMLDDLRRYLNVTPEENKKYFGNLGF